MLCAKGLRAWLTVTHARSARIRPVCGDERINTSGIRKQRCVDLRTPQRGCAERKRPDRRADDDGDVERAATAERAADGGALEGVEGVAERQCVRRAASTDRSAAGVIRPDLRLLPRIASGRMLAP